MDLLRIHVYYGHFWAHILRWNNSDRYVRLILTKFFAQLIEKERLHAWFKHNQATFHTADDYIMALEAMFGDENKSWFMASTFAWSYLMRLVFMERFEAQILYDAPRTEKS